MSGVRMTFGGKSAHLMYNLENSYQKMMTLQEQLSTGTKLQRPSDSPIDTTNVLKIQTKESMNEQFKRNIADGKAYLYNYDTVLQSSTTSLQRARELAIQGRSDTLSDEERDYIAEETVQITQSLIFKANTLYKGDYVFNGTQTDKAPYILKKEDGEALTAGLPGVAIQMGDNDVPVTHNVIPTTLTVTDGGTTTYTEGTDYEVDYVNGEITPLAGGALNNGDPFTVEYQSIDKSLYSNDEDINRLISEGNELTINIHASDVFETDEGNDIFETMIRFTEGLVENDTTAIENGITEIDEIMACIMTDTAENGAKINTLETQETDIYAQDIEIGNLLGEYLDIDYSKTISDFTMQSNLFESSMQAAGKIITPFLGSYV